MELTSKSKVAVMKSAEEHGSDPCFLAVSDKTPSSWRKGVSPKESFPNNPICNSQPFDYHLNNYPHTSLRSVSESTKLIGEITSMIGTKQEKIPDMVYWLIGRISLSWDPIIGL